MPYLPALRVWRSHSLDPREVRCTSCLLAGAVAGLALTTPLAAQRAAGPSFGITPYAGYMKFGNLVSGPIGTSLRNGGSAVYGAEATLGLSRAIALVGNVAYSQPNLEIGAPLIGRRVGRPGLGAPV